MTAVEQWRPVPDWPAYSVSDQGRVRSTHSWRGSAERVMSNRLNSKGYYAVILCRDGQQRTAQVHSLVAEAFLGPRDGLIVRHLNGVPTDNRLSNLAYGTLSDNMQDALRHGTLRNAWTHCKQGHELTPENVYTPPSASGSRYCRTCAKARSVIRVAKRQAARRAAA